MKHLLSAEFGDWGVGIDRGYFDATTIRVPDEEWSYVDAAGHEHRWVDGDVPTLWQRARLLDLIEGEISGYGEFSCIECGEVVDPGTRESTDTVPAIKRVVGWVGRSHPSYEFLEASLYAEPGRVEDLVLRGYAFKVVVTSVSAERAEFVVHSIDRTSHVGDRTP